MSQQDQIFMKTFTLVLVVLAVMGIAFYFIAQGISTKSETSSSEMADKAIAERIQPVGKVNVGDAKPAAESGAGKSGKEVVQASCAACHNTGVLGAPKIGAKGEWETRLTSSNGLDGLVASAIKGKGAMPPRGGGSFSDAEVKAAIEYMLKESNL